MKTKTKKKTIWIGHIPEAFGYGIMVASDTKEGAMKAVRKGWEKWGGDREMSLKEAFEYFGGSIHQIELDKSYNDNFS